MTWNSNALLTRFRQKLRRCWMGIMVCCNQSNACINRAIMIIMSKIHRTTHLNFQGKLNRKVSPTIRIHLKQICLVRQNLVVGTKNLEKEQNRMMTPVTNYTKTYLENDQSNYYWLVLEAKTFKQVFGVPHQSISSKLKKHKQLQKKQ